MSSLVPPTLPYSSGNRQVQSAASQLAQTEAFAAAVKQFAEPTPKAPNTDSSGNSRVQDGTHQQSDTTHTGDPHPASSSEPHSNSDSFQASHTAPQTPTRQPQQSASSQNASTANTATSQPSTSNSQSSASQTRSTAPSSSTDSIDTSARSTTQTTTTSSHLSGTETATSGDHASSQLDASMAQDLASLTGTAQTTTVRIESLGNNDAMTRELLKAIAEAGADPVTKASPETQAALASLSQKAVDNIPHMLVEGDPGKGVKLFVPDSHAANQIETAEAKVLASDTTRIQAAAELSQGPDWPHMMMEAMAKANEQWLDRFPQSNALQNAMLSLFGREVSVAQAGAHEDVFNKMASLANPPLNLPVAGLMHNELNQLTAFNVQQTHLAQDGHMWMTVLDVPASVDAGREVFKTMQAEQFAKVVYVLVVPDGRPAVSIQKQHEADLNTLGLIGCCLTSNGGGVGRHGNSVRTSAMGRQSAGLLENRCVTCARAQMLCQPKLV